MDAATIAFFIFGLGFFIYAIHRTDSRSDIDYMRQLREAREFGFKDSKLDPHAPKHKRR